MATTYMGLTLPTEGASSNVWDTLLNAIFELIDAHDHTTGKGTKVPSGGINIGANLAYGGYSATGLKSVRFTAQTSLTTETLGLGVKSNELYWVTSGGVEVKLTNGASLNTALVGGITGDYVAAGADCEYDDALKQFNFLQAEGPDHFAKVAHADIKLYEATSGITNHITLKSPAALAASYTLTLLTALPASTSLLTVTSAGQVAATRDPVVDSLTGSVNASGGTLTYASTGEKHTEKIQRLPPSAGMSPAAGWLYSPGDPSAAAWPEWNGPGISDVVQFPLPVPYGARLKRVDVTLHDTAAGGTISFMVGKVNLATIVCSQLGTTQTSLGDGSTQTLSVTGLTNTMDGDVVYAHIVANNATTGAHAIYGVTFYWDRV